MNKLRLFTLFLLVFCIITNCKKEERNNNDISDKFSASVFRNLNNQNDGLIADIINLSDNTHLYYYGNFDAVGNPDSIKSLVYSRINNDTLVNIILDDSFRVRFIYNSYKSNNIKDKYLHKFDYISKDSLLYSIYSYNWSNKLDSLVYQTRVVNNNGTTQYENLYGLRVSGILGDNLCSQAQLVATAISSALGVLGATAIGYWGGLVINPTFGAFAGIGVIVVWFANGACGQDLIQNANSNYPNSPNSGNTPNPVGSPDMPNKSKIPIIINKTNAFTSNPTFSSIDIQGEVMYNGGSQIITRGVCYGPNWRTINVLNDFKFYSSFNNFNITINGISYSTGFGFRLFAINSEGYVGYSEQFQANIKKIPGSVWNIVHYRNNVEIYHGQLTFINNTETLWEELHETPIFTENGYYHSNYNINNIIFDPDSIFINLNSENYPMYGEINKNTIIGYTGNIASGQTWKAINIR